MNTLGERLKYARKKGGYTQESLSEAIGISRGVIFNLEKDKTEPQGIVVNAVCQTLKINKDWLLYGVGDMEDKSETSRSAKILAELYDSAKSLSEEEQLFLLDTIKALKFRLGENPKA
ncbi:helix-turn-helix domain-containing protein [Caproiciproducens sp. R1]|uniref:helix-turn-helix domain-containing protein n=1 Tax=Caproiciproducens sp. R1 TaxID=3435000 RepID=UPI004033CF65